MLNWKTLSEEEFNRAVEMLIVRTVEADHPGLYATAVDGRGGDGGVDIDVRVKKTDQLVTIYQLKYFPEGFSGGWAATRKKQIRKSFQAAMEHEPPKWVLVIPGNYTPKERSFTTSLRENKPKPRIERIGKTELDIMLARFPEVEDYIKRNESLSALEIVGRESALLAKPGDVLTEVGLLEKRIQAQSIYWTRDFGSVGGQQFETIRALRPDAEDREPLTFTLITDFTGEEALGEQYKYALDYGLREPLRLPGKVVTKFEQHGPDWFAGVLGVNGIDLLPQPQDLAGPVKLVLRNEDGKTLAQPKALRAQVVSGAKGALLTVTVYPGLDLTIEFDRRPIGPGRINYQVMLQDLSGVEARQALRFLSALPNATTLAFEVDKVDPFSLTFAGVADPPPPGLVELADDLAAIEAELGVRFAFPETLPKAHERIWIRVIRRIFEGAVSFVPGTSALTFTVTGPFASGDNELLTDSAVNVGLHVDDWEWEILGQNIVVGDVTVGVFHGHAVDGADHLAALIADPEKSRSVTFVPGAALPGVLIYSLDRKKPDAVIEPSPWSLSNVSEHPYFAAVDDDQDSDTAA